MHHVNTAFITGASSGIGEALAKKLAARGVEVALSARREDKLSSLATNIQSSGGKATAYPVDVTNVAAIQETIRDADDSMGGLDLVVACAGVFQERWSGKLRPRDWELTVAVNVTGAVATLTAITDRMCERKKGHLVGVSSLAQYRGLPRNAAYCGSKAFLSRFLEALRVDVAGAKVTVTDVRPGYVKTPMTEQSRESVMPWMVSAEDAADIIAKGIGDKEPVIRFPWQLSTIIRSTTLMPPKAWTQGIQMWAGKTRK